MPKMKTKSAAKKRFKITAKGRVKANSAYLRHNLRRRTTKVKRQARHGFILCKADEQIVKSYLPYSR